MNSLCARPWVSVILLGLSAVLHAGDAPATLESRKPDAPRVIALPAAAGKSVGGLRLELLPPAESQYTQSDDIRLQLRFVNLTDLDMKIQIDSCCTFYDQVFLVNEDGAARAADRRRERRRHLGPQWMTVPAGGFLGLDQLLAQWVVVDKPGHYRRLPVPFLECGSHRPFDFAQSRLLAKIICSRTKEVRGVEPAPTLALGFAGECFVLLGPGLPQRIVTPD